MGFNALDGWSWIGTYGGGIARVTDDAFFMHCLPVRRNVVVADGVLDSSRSAVIDEAENRLWTAAAVFCALGGP